MRSGYQNHIKQLKALPSANEAYLAECAKLLQTSPLLSKTEYGACRGILEAAAMRVGVRAAKAASSRYTGQKGVDPAMDVVQEATVGALAAVNTWDYEGGASFTGWLMARAVGAAIDWFRWDRGYGMGGRDYIADHVAIDALLNDDDAMGDDPLAAEPLEEVITSVDSRTIHELVSKLPTRLRNIVASYYGYRTATMTLAELAKRENVSIATIRNRLEEARLALRKLALLSKSGDILGIED